MGLVAVVLIAYVLVMALVAGLSAFIVIGLVLTR